MKLEEAISALKRYQEHRLHPGSFLSAVLSNDLQGAVNYADRESLDNLPDIARYVFSRMPSNIWGSNINISTHLQKSSV